jgi:hypothetical protein
MLGAVKDGSDYEQHTFCYKSYFKVVSTLPSRYDSVIVIIRRCYDVGMAYIETWRKLLLAVLIRDEGMVSKLLVTHILIHYCSCSRQHIPRQHLRLYMNPKTAPLKFR